MGKVFVFFILSDAGETESERREQLRQKRAEIARCWIKYCLNLLQDAKKLLEVVHNCKSYLLVGVFFIFGLMTWTRVT